MQHDPEYDVRADIFRSIADRVVHAQIVADADGVVAQVETACELAGALGLTVDRAVGPGERVKRGDPILSLRGSPMQIAKGEDRLIGAMAKASGVATMAQRFVDEAAGRLTIVAGAWKKMPLVLKEAIRSAAELGGARSRISPTPFLYLDKNYTAMFGGITATLAAVETLAGYRRVIQVAGQHGDICLEAEDAVRAGADIVFVDTGRLSDLAAVGAQLSRHGLRSAVELAFGGGVTITMIDPLTAIDVDLVDIGRSIVDAPLLDMRLTIRHVG